MKTATNQADLDNAALDAEMTAEEKAYWAAAGEAEEARG